jgi:hypothetical protein
LYSIHDCPHRRIGLIRGKAIRFGNKSLYFGRLDNRRLLRVLDIGDPLVVVVGNPLQSLAQAIDSVRALIERFSFRLELFG